MSTVPSLNKKNRRINPEYITVNALITGPNSKEPAKDGYLLNSAETRGFIKENFDDLRKFIWELSVSSTSFGANYLQS